MSDKGERRTLRPSGRGKYVHGKRILCHNTSGMMLVRGYDHLRSPQIAQQVVIAVPQVSTVVLHRPHLSLSIRQSITMLWRRSLIPMNQRLRKLSFHIWLLNQVTGIFRSLNCFRNLKVNHTQSLGFLIGLVFIDPTRFMFYLCLQLNK